MPSLTAAANPAAFAAGRAIEPGAQQELNLARDCGPRGFRDRTAAITFVDEHHNIWLPGHEEGFESDEQHQEALRHRRTAADVESGRAGGLGRRDGLGKHDEAIAWTLPNCSLALHRILRPKVGIAWVPGLNATCQTP